MDLRHLLKAVSCIGGLLSIAVLLVSYPSSFQTLHPVPQTHRAPEWFTWWKERPLADYDRTRLLSGDFKTIRTFKHLPERLQIALGLMVGVDPSSVEDPIGALPEGCIEFPLPRGVRLLFAGVSTNKWFVHYEAGGAACRYLVEVFEVSEDLKVAHLARIFTNRGACDLDELRRVILEESCRTTGDGGVV